MERPATHWLLNTYNKHEACHRAGFPVRRTQVISERRNPALTSLFDVTLATWLRFTSLEVI
jgi:hypothetical protein